MSCVGSNPTCSAIYFFKERVCFMKKLLQTIFASVFFVLMITGSCFASLQPSFFSNEKPVLVKVWFKQPNCIPDIDDSWYRQVFSMVQNELGNRNIKVVDSYDAWQIFMEDKVGKPLNKDKVRTDYNNFINSNYSGVINVNVDKYAKYPNGISDVSVSISCVRGDDNSSFTTSSSISDKTDKTLLQLLNQCIIESL